MASAADVLRNWDGGWSFQACRTCCPKCGGHDVVVRRTVEYRPQTVFFKRAEVSLRAAQKWIEHSSAALDERAYCPCGWRGKLKTALVI